MDIAKIRKKIKEEAEIRKGEREKEKTPDETVRQQEGSSEIPCEPESCEAGEKPVVEETEVGLRRRLTEAKTQDTEIKVEKSGERTDIVPEKTPGPETVIKTPEPMETIEDEDIVELLTFCLSTEDFAFRVSDIEEILRFQRIATVPKVPDYILGITSLRGKIIPVIDLRKRLSIKVEEEMDLLRKKILILKGSRGPIGTLIDKVKGVVRISLAEIVDPPAHLTEIELMFIEGVVLYHGRFISVIRMEKISDVNFK
ncbi:MAG: purine-binding chemotaxis protein CheW [Nitrospirae bacterium]|nr:purine-binding chemotaxis protein CheW [Nitrospirota bacterium]